jgi:hypothetical protein
MNTRVTATAKLAASPTMTPPGLTAHSLHPPADAAAGRARAVRRGQRTYRLLARRLADLDADPDLETEQLVADLLRRPGA